MASGTDTAISTFFLLCWGTLSAVGLHNVLVGLMIAGIIRSFSMVLLVPIVVSAACALANGLCYYVFYTDYPDFNKAIACAFMDLAWMIQEAGLTFYGYAILTNVLLGSERMIFLTLFWVLMFVITVVRVNIIVLDVRFFLDVTVSPTQHSAVVARLHLGYFVPIAMAECLCAVFLLKKFRARHRALMLSPLKGGSLYRYLMLSTEIRVAALALIGISRAVTFSFNTILQEKGMAAEFDLFVYALGCFFPMVMLIDILTSRLMFAEECSMRNNLNSAPASAEATPFGDAEGEEHDNINRPSSNSLPLRR